MHEGPTSHLDYAAAAATAAPAADPPFGAPLGLGGGRVTFSPGCWSLVLGGLLEILSFDVGTNALACALVVMLLPAWTFEVDAVREVALLLVVPLMVPTIVVKNCEAVV